VVSRRKLFWAATSFSLMLTVSFVIFLLLPVEVRRSQIVGAGVYSISYLSQVGLDSKFNAFPSLHVSLSTLSWLLIRENNKQISNWLFPALSLMIISTLSVKQPAFIDVMGGLAIAGLAYLFCIKFGSIGFGKQKSLA
jgi:membrane-associated phospholipid phosphatase